MRSETAWLVKWGALAWGLGVLGGVGVAVGCGGRLLEEPPARVDALGGGVDPGPGDASAVLAARVEGDVLRVTVQHAGGCAEHAFRWHWAGEWLESSPVQAQLTLHHDARGDACEALVQRELELDLRPLREAYRASYRVEHSTVRLVLRGTDVSVAYAF